jgi:hypothetical protein
VTIVVDEAPIAFEVSPTTRNSDIRKMIAALDFFIWFSKSKLKVRGIARALMPHFDLGGANHAVLGFVDRAT